MRAKIVELFLILVGIFLLVLVLKQQENVKHAPHVDYGAEIIDFEGFDNENGLDKHIVPNIFHLIYFNNTELTFDQTICIFSIYLNHKPDFIFIHCDNCSFHGRRWSNIMAISDLKQRIQVKQLSNARRTIFAQKYGWENYHRSDVYRLLVLMNYGGIYVDNDVFVVNSLDKYRKYEMAISWDEEDGEGIGTQVLIAHKNARLLKAHFDAYRQA